MTSCLERSIRVFSVPTFRATVDIVQIPTRSDGNLSELVNLFLVYGFVVAISASDCASKSRTLMSSELIRNIISRHVFEFPLLFHRSWVQCSIFESLTVGKRNCGDSGKCGLRFLPVEWVNP